jgi:hypothetical protein
MAHYITIILLIVGSLGWILFLYSILQVISSRRRELNLIQEIKSVLKNFKKDIVDIKKNS